VPATISAERVEAAFSARGAQWLRRYHDETDPIPGSVETLRELHASGRILGIATSSGRDVPFLRRWGVRELFSAIVGREDVEQRKPAPDVVLRCLDRLDVQSQEAIYVGDSPIDIQAGRAAGVATVGVLTGASPRSVLAAEGPDAVLSSIAELPRLGQAKLTAYGIEAESTGLRAVVEEIGLGICAHRRTVVSQIGNGLLEHRQHQQLLRHQRPPLDYGRQRLDSPHDAILSSPERTRCAMWVPEPLRMHAPMRGRHTRCELPCKRSVSSPPRQKSTARPVSPGIQVP
jgi:HAD superfamily hydrolase (TIGR01509 family)